MQVLTPSKKVRQLAAARPVLYLGSGTPPPRPVVFDDDEDKTAGDAQSTATSALGSKPESGGAESAVAS